jgi:hypothetical protein
MQHRTWISAFVLAGTIVLLGAADRAIAQQPAQQPAQPAQPPREPPPFALPQPRDPAARPPAPPPTLICRGPISTVLDLAYEDVKVTSAVYGTTPGGGEGRQYDPTPLLSTTITLVAGSCLNAHLSAIVGSKQTYGIFGQISPITMFQVSLTRVTPPGTPRHMVGHYESPYGVVPSSPGVFIEAERAADHFAANFFQRFGNQPHDLPPGTYRVDVWWAGAPSFAGPGGAIGAGFVLKLYFR